MTCKPWTFGILAALTLLLSAPGLSRLQLETNEHDATVKAARAFTTSETPERDFAPAEPSQKPS